jgi:hypothetical protein
MQKPRLSAGLRISLNIQRSAILLLAALLLVALLATLAGLRLLLLLLAALLLTALLLLLLILILLLVLAHRSPLALRVRIDACEENAMRGRFVPRASQVGTSSAPLS